MASKDLFEHVFDQYDKASVVAESLRDRQTRLSAALLAFVAAGALGYLTDPPPMEDSVARFVTWFRIVTVASLLVVAWLLYTRGRDSKTERAMKRAHRKMYPDIARPRHASEFLTLSSAETAELLDELTGEEDAYMIRADKYVRALDLLQAANRRVSRRQRWVILPFSVATLSLVSTGVLYLTHGQEERHPNSDPSGLQHGGGLREVRQDRQPGHEADAPEHGQAAESGARDP